MPRLDTLEPRCLLALSLHVDAGAGESFLDTIGRTFAPSSGFVGGRDEVVKAYEVLGTDDDALFFTARQGSSFLFSKQVPDGRYNLLLEFAESEVAFPGERLFDVSAEGHLVLDDYDIVADAGGWSGTAVARSADVRITDGSLDLNFTGVVGEALVSAIVLIPTDTPLVAAPYGWDGLSEAQRLETSQRHLGWIGNGIFTFGNDHRGKTPRDLREMHEYFQDRFATYAASPRTSTALPRGEMSMLESTGWVRRSRDFVYVNPGSFRYIDENTVLAYDNPDRVNGGINMLFGDGTVRYLEREAAAQLIGFPNVPPSDPPDPWPVVPPPDPDITASRENLRTIYEKLSSFANLDHGLFAPDMGTLLQRPNPPAVETFVNPRTGTLPPPADWDVKQKSVWVNTLGDYTYMGAYRSRSAWSAVDVLAFEKTRAGVADGINLLFGDGHVEFREIGWADETLAHQLPPAAAPPWLYASSVNDYTFAGSTLTIHGHVTFSGDASSTHPALDVAIEPGATARFLATQHLQSLTINGSASLYSWNFSMQHDRYLRVGSLSIAPGASLDLGPYELIVDYAPIAPSPLWELQSWINSARAGGTWSGSGLTSEPARWSPRNTSLGALESVDYLTAHGAASHFNGEPLDGSMVLVKFTYYGDADLSGRVDMDDFVWVDRGFNTSSSGWFAGDFDGNGTLDFDDLVLMDHGYNTQSEVL